MSLQENTQKWRKTKRGMVTNLFDKLKNRHPVSFELSDLHVFSKCPKFDRLFKEWEKSNYNKQFKPTIDRINLKLGYSLNNIHWLTWAENRYKQRMETKIIRARKVGMFLDNKLIKEFKSVTEAVKQTGVAQSNLSSCLSGKRKTTYGYVWKYTDTRERSHSIKDIKINCCNCGIEFIPQNKTIKYCSRKCGSTGNANAQKHLSVIGNLHDNPNLINN